MMVKVLKETTKNHSTINPTQIPKNEREQIRVRQKGNIAEFRIWAKSKMGFWKPTSHTVTVSMERIATLQSEFKEIADSFPTLKSLVETLNKHGVEIPAEIQSAAETMAKAMSTYTEAHEKEVAVFEMESFQAIRKLKEVKI